MGKKFSRRSLQDDAFSAEDSVSRRSRVMGQEFAHQLDGENAAGDDGTRRREESHRRPNGRPGSNVFDANGTDPIADSQPGSLRCHSDRNSPVSISKHDAGNRFHAAGCAEDARAGPRQETAIGPDDRSQRDQCGGKEGDHAANRTKRSHAETLVRTELRRLFGVDQQAIADASTTSGLEEPRDPPQQGGSIRRRDEFENRKTAAFV